MLIGGIMKTVRNIKQTLSNWIWKIEVLIWMFKNKHTFLHEVVSGLLAVVFASTVTSIVIVHIPVLLRIVQDPQSPFWEFLIASLIIFAILGLSVESVRIPLSGKRIQKVFDEFETIKIYRQQALRKAYAKRESFEKYPLKHIGFDGEDLSNLETDVKNALSVASLCPTDSPSYPHFEAQANDLIVGVKEDVDWFLKQIDEAEAKIARTAKVVKALRDLMDIWYYFEIEDIVPPLTTSECGLFPDKYIQDLLEYVESPYVQNITDTFELIKNGSAYRQKKLMAREFLCDGDSTFHLRNPFAEKIPPYLRNWPQE